MQAHRMNAGLAATWRSTWMERCARVHGGLRVSAWRGGVHGGLRVCMERCARVHGGLRVSAWRGGVLHGGLRVSA
eukprot:353109-Chlamydomonas_euryale.AAC.5